MPETTISPAQLAAMYGVSVFMVEDMVRAGQIPSRCVGGRLEIPLRRLNAQLRRVDGYRIPGMLPIAERPVVAIVRPVRPRRRRERPAA